MRIFFFHIAFLLILPPSQAQIRHQDYIGAGHSNMIKVTSSSSSSEAIKTIDGFDIQNEDQLKHASRFLAHCTFGTDYHTIQTVAAMGYEAWLDEQFSLPIISFHDEEMNQTLAGYGFGYRLFGSSWMTNTLTTPDILRQRISFALSQILVLSGNTMMVFQRTDAHPLSAYYDILQKHSFGNYFPLLHEVALSPQMGHFLSHYNNPKADTLTNVHPDENFAREIMQLFSIGLWELNPDGSRKLDQSGNDIPSYNNNDIKEFAKVFTGLSTNRNASFGSLFGGDWTAPMQMFEEFHDTSEKHLLNGVVLPSDQPGLVDIKETVSHLCEHQNIAPFISKALIQLLVSSNPSPQYIEDVSSVFDPFQENNLQEVIKAILLHPSARQCDPSTNPSFGKLREPLVRMMNLLKAFPMSTNEFGDYFNYMRCPIHTFGQAPLQAPSVFNFFQRDYSPTGEISQNYLVAPEFQILNAPNTIGFINDMDTRILQEIYMDDGCGIFGMFEPMHYQEDISHYAMDFSILDDLLDDPALLVRHLNIHIANGLLSEDTEDIIIQTLEQIDEPKERLKFCLYAILISPDYAILK